MSEHLLARALAEVAGRGIPEAQGQVAGLEQKLDLIRSAYATGRMSLDRYLERSQALQARRDRLASAVAAAARLFPQAAPPRSDRSVPPLMSLDPRPDAEPGAAQPRDVRLDASRRLAGGPALARSPAHDRAEAARFASALAGGALARQYLRQPLGEAELRDRISGLMRQAGLPAATIDRTLDATARTLRARLDANVHARARDRGISEVAARSEILDEMEQGRPATSRSGSFLHGADAIFRAAQVRANESGEIPRKQLVTLEKIERHLRKPPRLVARFGPNRG